MMPRIDPAGPPDAPGDREDLIQRLESRALIEGPPDDDPDADLFETAEITWAELAEIAALLREAAAVLRESKPSPAQEKKP